MPKKQSKSRNFSLKSSDSSQQNQKLVYDDLLELGQYAQFQYSEEEKKQVEPNHLQKKELRNCSFLIRSRHRTIEITEQMKQQRDLKKWSFVQNDDSSFYNFNNNNSSSRILSQSTASVSQNDQSTDVIDDSNNSDDIIYNHIQNANHQNLTVYVSPQNSMIFHTSLPQNDATIGNNIPVFNNHDFSRIQLQGTASQNDQSTDAIDDSNDFNNIIYNHIQNTNHQNLTVYVSPQNSMILHTSLPQNDSTIGNNIPVFNNDNLDMSDNNRAFENICGLMEIQTQIDKQEEEKKQQNRIKTIKTKRDQENQKYRQKRFKKKYIEEISSDEEKPQNQKKIRKNTIFVEYLSSEENDSEEQKIVYVDPGYTSFEETEEDKKLIFNTEPLDTNYSKFNQKQNQKKGGENTILFEYLASDEEDKKEGEEEKKEEKKYQCQKDKKLYFENEWCKTCLNCLRCCNCKCKQCDIGYKKYPKTCNQCDCCIYCCYSENCQNTASNSWLYSKIAKIKYKEIQHQLEYLHLEFLQLTRDIKQNSQDIERLQETRSSSFLSFPGQKQEIVDVQQFQLLQKSCTNLTEQQLEEKLSEIRKYKQDFPPASKEKGKQVALYMEIYFLLALQRNVRFRDRLSILRQQIDEQEDQIKYYNQKWGKIKYSDI